MTPEPLSAEERLAWLRLARTPNVGPVTFHRLVRRYRSAQAALDALPALARRGGRIDPLAIASADLVKREEEVSAKAGAQLLTLRDAAYPRLLARLEHPPAVITVLGDAARLAQRSVALVGARSASAIGRRFAHDIARDLSQADFLVVSGLARGVDAAAHDGALKGDAGTVAVVAGGVDNIYPPENAALRARIIEQGAVVSERPFGRVPKARDFPRRNGIISGLSEGVVVIEAAERSGSLITARLAGEQGREVMAAPGSPLDPRAKGANRLIREGAALIENARDVRDVLDGARLSATFEPGQDYEDPPLDEAALDEAADKVRDRVAELLSPTPTPRDDVVRFSEAPASAVAAALVELELAGRAVQLPGGFVVSSSSDEGACA